MVGIQDFNISILIFSGDRESGYGVWRTIYQDSTRMPYKKRYKNKKSFEPGSNQWPWDHVISITVPRSSKLSYRRPAGSRSSSCLSMSIYIATYCATSESLPVSLQLTFLEARSVIQGKSLAVSNGSNIPTLAESPVLALIKRYVLQN